MGIESVREHLKKYNAENRIIELDKSSATVELAAKALGCIPARIAKTLAFEINGGVILVIAAGDTKIDNSKFKKFFAAKAKMISPDNAQAFIGHQVGGICPFGINEGIKVYLDESLKRFDTVYPACGSPNSAIELKLEELEKFSEYDSWIDVCELYA